MKYTFVGGNHWGKLLDETGRVVLAGSREDCMSTARQIMEGLEGDVPDLPAAQDEPEVVEPEKPEPKKKRGRPKKVLPPA